MLLAFVAALFFFVFRAAAHFRTPYWRPFPNGRLACLWMGAIFVFLTTDPHPRKRLQTIDQEKAAASHERAGFRTASQKLTIIPETHGKRASAKAPPPESD
jgi:hypothetical protein